MMGYYTGDVSKDCGETLAEMRNYLQIYDVLRPCENKTL